MYEFNGRSFEEPPKYKLDQKRFFCPTPQMIREGRGGTLAKPGTVIFWTGEPAGDMIPLNEAANFRYTLWAKEHPEGMIHPLDNLPITAERVDVISEPELNAPGPLFSIHDMSGGLAAKGVIQSNADVQVLSSPKTPEKTREPLEADEASLTPSEIARRDAKAEVEIVAAANAAKRAKALEASQKGFPDAS